MVYVSFQSVSAGLNDNGNVKLKANVIIICVQVVIRRRNPQWLYSSGLLTRRSRDRILTAEAAFRWRHNAGGQCAWIWAHVGEPEVVKFPEPSTPAPHQSLLYHKGKLWLLPSERACFSVAMVHTVTESVFPFIMDHPVNACITALWVLVGVLLRGMN